MEIYQNALFRGRLEEKSLLAFQSNGKDLSLLLN